MRKISLLVGILMLFFSGIHDIAIAQPPAYMRYRPAPDQPAYVGTSWGGMPTNDYFVGAYPGYAYYGSWYQRPYPYHFDYYRGRWAPRPAQEAPCPCIYQTQPE